MLATGQQPVARRAGFSRPVESLNRLNRSQTPRRALTVSPHRRSAGAFRRVSIGVAAGAALVGGIGLVNAQPAAAAPVEQGLPKLGRNDTGKAVKRLQRELSAYGPNVAATGYYGKVTTKRVKRVQRKHGWKQTGVAGPRVWHVLLTDGHQVKSPALSSFRHTISHKKSVAKRAVKSASVSSTNTVWDKIAQCESGGNWSINTGNGFYGGLQFTLQTWHAYGGSGMPNHASRTEQIRIAQKVQAGQGWGAWPACTSRLGIR